jgi:hypothetical protein
MKKARSMQKFDRKKKGNRTEEKDHLPRGPGIQITSAMAEGKMKYQLQP